MMPPAMLSAAWLGRARSLVSRRPARVTGLGLAVALVAGLLVTGAHDGYPTTRVLQDSGLAWVTSDQIGSLTLLDGIAGQPVVNVHVAGGKRDSLLAGQAGTTGFALDAATGQLTRVDGSSYATRATQGSLTNFHRTLQFLVGPRTADVVDGEENVVTAYDPATLAQASQSLLFAQGPSNDTAIIDSSSRLWTVDQDSGRLAWFSGTAAGLGPRVFTPGASLVLADGEPVVVDAGAGRAYLIGPGGSATASLALGAGAGPGSAFSGATAQQALVVTDSARGTYQTCSFAVGTCGRPRGGGFRGHILGSAVTADDRIFVPDYTSGTVWVLDPAGTAPPVDTPALTRAGPFDLFYRNGLVFYNDPQTSQAGTIAADGTPSPIVKYSPSATPAATTTGSPALSPAPTTKAPAAGRPSTPPASTPTPPASPGQAPATPSTPHSGGNSTPSPGPVRSKPGGSTASCAPGASLTSALLAGAVRDPAIRAGSGSPPPSPQTPVTLTDPGSTGVYGIAYAPSGTLAVGDLNGSSYLWNVAARKVTAIFPGTLAAGVFGLALSPNASLLATNTLNPGKNYGNAGIDLWSTATCQRLAIMNDPQSDGVGNPVAFSPDGATLAADDANGCIYLWSTTSFKRTGKLCEPGSGDRDYGIAFSPAGLLAAGDIDGHTYLWNTAGGGSIAATIAEPGGAPVKSVAFSSAGVLATGDNAGNVYLWNVTTGTKIATLQGIAGATVTSIAFSARTDLVAATVDDTTQHVYEVVVWTAAGKVLTAFRSASIGGTRLAFSPDGRSLAVGDENAHTYIWDVSHLG